MNKDKHTPWASGPGEILKHGIELLRDDSDTNRRLAMISIDNAVELTIKTFIGLPKRVSGINVSRKEFGEISESFPKLLDALEIYSSEKIDGVDLGEIEWYHRLRNELYHNGNGLTVEREKVEVYAELANLLFFRLFDVQLVEEDQEPDEVLGKFIREWSFLEKGLIAIAKHWSQSHGEVNTILDATQSLYDVEIMNKHIFRRINKLRELRNKLVHGAVDHKEVLTAEVLKELEEVLDWLEVEGEIKC